MNETVRGLVGMKGKGKGSVIADSRVAAEIVRGPVGADSRAAADIVRGLVGR